MLFIFFYQDSYFSFGTVNKFGLLLKTFFCLITLASPQTILIDLNNIMPVELMTIGTQYGTPSLD